jgi:hypothetical protein
MKPVAYLMIERNTGERYVQTSIPTREEKISHEPYPIYNTWVGLTPEEIKDFTVRIYNCRTGAEAHEIVLAILRKAQEK